jgi:hypothetical protein
MLRDGQLAQLDPVSSGGSGTLADRIFAILGRSAPLLPAPTALTVFEIIDVILRGEANEQGNQPASARWTWVSAPLDIYRAGRVHEALVGDARFSRVVNPSSGAAGATKWTLT